MGCAIWELIVAFSDGTLGTVDADEMREELEDVLQLYYELNGDGTGQEVPQTIYRIPGDGEGPAGSA